VYDTIHGDYGLGWRMKNEKKITYTGNQVICTRHSGDP
jgi:hypothetical protein